MNTAQGPSETIPLSRRKGDTLASRPPRPVPSNPLSELSAGPSPPVGLAR